MLLLCEVGFAACWYQMFNIMRWGMFLGNKRQTIQSAVWNLFSQPFFYCTCSPVFLYATVFLSLRCFFPSSFLLSLPPASLPLFLLCLWVSFLVFSLLPLCLPLFLSSLFSLPSWRLIDPLSSLPLPFSFSLSSPY